MSTLERKVADLRMQFDVLEKATKATSLPEAVTRMRETVKWSAVAVAVALVLSSVLRMLDDGQRRAFEDRILLLERYHKAYLPPLP